MAATDDSGTATTPSSVVSTDFIRSFPFWFVPFVIMGLAVYGGIGWNLLISLTDYQGFAPPNYGHLDLQMYVKALTSPRVIATGRNTFVLLVAFTTICLVLGLLLAILLDRKIRYEGKVQTIYLLPMSLSFVVTAQMWLWLYNYDNGFVNALTSTLGLGKYHWIGDPGLVLGAVVFAFVWQFSGYTMIVYLAGLRSIPTDQFEAAMVDGAPLWRVYARVIVPQLKASSVSAAVVLMIFGLKTFTFLYAMFGTFRPPKGVDILATLMVRQAFKYQNWAYASAIATILLLLALGVIAPYLYYQYRQGAL